MISDQQVGQGDQRGGQTSDPRLRAYDSRRQVVIGRITLAAIVTVYVMLALAYAHYVPAWQAPDEPAHFNYVAYLADRGQLPVLKAGDYPEGIPLGPKASNIDIASFRYEAHQPPLYYGIAAVLYKLGARVFLLRALSVLFAACLLLTAYACAATLFPRSVAVQVAVPAFVAFIPMHIFTSASIDNDTLAELVLSLLLLLYLRVTQGLAGAWIWPVAGLLFALGLLTKLTIYLPGALLVVGLLWIAARRGELSRAISSIALITVVLAGWWFVRNGFVYGWQDVLIQSRQAEVAGAQTHTGVFGWQQMWLFSAGSFHSFWAQFGWMSIPVANATYVKLWLLTGGAVIGLAIGGIRYCIRSNAQRQGQPANSGTEDALTLIFSRFGGRDAERTSRLLFPSFLALTLIWLAVVAEDLYYNLTFLQLQGRYLFPALIPVAIAYVCGLSRLVPRALQGPLLALVCVSLLWFSLYSLRHDLIPAFA